MALVDEISPAYVGEDRIRLTLANREQVLRAFVPVVVAVDYSACAPEGVTRPLEMSVTDGSGRLLVRQAFRRFDPAELAFTPREGGSHLVRLAEQFHNQWWGSLVLQIAGDRVRE